MTRIRKCTVGGGQPALTDAEAEAIAAAIDRDDPFERAWDAVDADPLRGTFTVGPEIRSAVGALDATIRRPKQ